MSLHSRMQESCYLAGFLDAEACFVRARWARISVSNTHLPSLLRLRDTYGGTVRSNKKRSDKHRQCYEWSVSGDDARAVAASVLPFLREKSLQAWLLLIALDYPCNSKEAREVEETLKALKRPEFTTEGFQCLS